jgi:EAL domain-containing protein (putative c-di-GMP-specific phosphodiesterase class I)
MSLFRSLQSSGAVICVDGAGEGFFTGQRLTELEPEIIKIARPLIDRCDVDPDAEQRVRELVRLSRLSGALSVAIGVERSSQSDLLQRIGVDAVQGHLVGRPSLDFDVASRLIPF